MAAGTHVDVVMATPRVRTKDALAVSVTLQTYYQWCTTGGAMY